MYEHKMKFNTSIHLVIFCIITMSLAQLYGQIDSDYNIDYKGDNLPFKKIKTEFTTTESAQNYLTELKKELNRQGYLSASFDSIQIEKNKITTNFHLGQLYTLNELSFNENDDQLSKFVKSGLRGNADLISSYTLEKIRGNYLRELENSGYPFASVTFDSLSIDDNKFNVNLSTQRGPLIKFDTLSNAYKNKVSIGYLKGFTGIFPGRPYDESKIRTLDAKLREIPFLQMEKPSEVYFKNDEAKINLFLKAKKVNRFDFLLGVLPNSNVTGKVLITGEAKVKLLNPFGTGKKLNINWRRLKPQSQDLNLYFDYPYIAASPLGADVAFTLNKRDTSYININYNIGINYQLRPAEKVSLFVENEQSLLLSVDSNRIKQTKQLPSVLDSRNTLFGLAYTNENLDYLYNPRKGYRFTLSAFAGNKKIKPSDLITTISDPTFEFGNIYESVETNSIKWGFAWRAEYFQPIGQRQTFQFKVSGKTQQNNSLLENELYRIGGTKNLRGFDEELFLVSTYNILTSEYRFLTGQNAYFSLFIDFGLLHSKTKDEVSRLDFPLGFGTGINLETKAGIFGINYALGRSNEIPFQFRSAKIHFGYVNVF